MREERDRHAPNTNHSASGRAASREDRKDRLPLRVVDGRRAARVEGVDARRLEKSKVDLGRMGAVVKMGPGRGHRILVGRNRLLMVARAVANVARAEVLMLVGRRARAQTAGSRARASWREAAAVGSGGTSALTPSSAYRPVKETTTARCRSDTRLWARLHQT